MKHSNVRVQVDAMRTILMRVIDDNNVVIDDALAKVFFDRLFKKVNTALSLKAKAVMKAYLYLSQLVELANMGNAEDLLSYLQQLEADSRERVQEYEKAGPFERIEMEQRFQKLCYLDLAEGIRAEENSVQKRTSSVSVGSILE